MKKDSRVDDYLKNAAPFAKPILKQLRKIVRESCPEAEETLKWDSPFYTYQGKILCGMGEFKAHCKFFFYKRVRLIKERGASAKKAAAQLYYISKASEIPKASVMKSLLREAMKFNEPGAKKIKGPPRKKKPPLKTPVELMKALRANPKALAVYREFSPSHQRHYSEWILDAKTEPTRQARLQKAVKAIAAGKTKHWD